METTNSIEFGVLIMGLLGGLAIFLYGMEQLTDALKRVAGSRMKKLLATLTTNRFTGVLAGAISTAIVQSSSVTTVLTVGFVSAGLMTFPKSIGIIFGAEIGTTITAQIIAFKVTKYAMAIVAIGFLMQFVFRKEEQERTRQYGIAIMGLGLVFLGLNLMGGATKPLRSYEPFINLMQQMSNPLFGIMVGALFTAIIQSSSATTGIIIMLAGQGLITLEAGIALAFGANIGTCVTALLAAIGKPREAVRTSVVHLVFNLTGVLIWFAFIPQIAELMRAISPVATGLTGVEKLAAETPRQIANAHTTFNTVNTLIFIWFVGPMAKLVEFLVPDRAEAKPVGLQPQYLEGLLLETPNLALEQVRMELGRLGVYASRMVQDSLPKVCSGTKEELVALVKMDEDIDSLHQQIMDYLALLSEEELMHSQAELLSDYMAVANYIENIGNVIKVDLVDAGNERLLHNAQISQETKAILKGLYEKVLGHFKESLDSLVKDDKRLAENVIAAKPTIEQLINEAEAHLARRLVVKEPNRALLFRIEFEIIEYLKRVYSIAERIAKLTAEVRVVNARSDAGSPPELRELKFQSQGA
jgi:phosphate:Na+ symporter